MRTSLKLVVAALSCSTLLPAFAQLAFVDAAQPLIDRYGWSHQYFGTPHPNFGLPTQRIAQTLTIETNGKMVGVFLPIDCMYGAYSTRGSGAVNVEIRDVDAGLPGPTVFDYALVGANYFDRGGRFTFVPLSGGLAVAPGQQFAIVLENGAGGCELSASAPWIAPWGAPLAAYAGGTSFFENSYTSGVWIPFNATGYGADDIPFQLVLQ